MLVEMPADDPEPELSQSNKADIGSIEPNLTSRPSTPVTLISCPTESPGQDADELEDPNDPEWESSQGSAPRNKKRWKPFPVFLLPIFYFLS